MAIYPLGDFDRVYQLRAQWSHRVPDRGESSWSLRAPRSAGWHPEHVYQLWLDNLEAKWCAVRPGYWALRRIIVEERWPQEHPAYVVDYGSGRTYDSDFEGLPSQCTPVVSWRTDEIGRAHRGRTYWGPVRRRDVEEDEEGGDLEDAIPEWADQMLETFGVDAPFLDPELVIVSRQFNLAPREPPVFTRVLYWLDSQIIWTQRRRNRHHV